MYVFDIISLSFILKHIEYKYKTHRVINQDGHLLSIDLFKSIVLILIHQN